MRDSLWEIRPYVRRVAVLSSLAHRFREASLHAVSQSYLTHDHHKSHHTKVLVTSAWSQSPAQGVTVDQCYGESASLGC